MTTSLCPCMSRASALVCSLRMHHSLWQRLRYILACLCFGVCDVTGDEPTAGALRCSEHAFVQLSIRSLLFVVELGVARGTDSSFAGNSMCAFVVGGVWVCPPLNAAA